MDIDLILTARDRRVETLRFFASLASQQGAGQIRVLFADQGLGIYSEALEIISQQSDISLQYQGIPPSPLSVARNEAIKMGLRSRIIGFPDDDCWYGPAVISSVQRIFNDQPEVDCICTNVYDPVRGLSYGGRPVGIRLPVNFSNIFALPISVGIFVRREAFEAVGPRFDETLGAGTVLGSGEETELIARLLQSGVKILYAGDISVFHPVPNYNKNDAGKFHAYGLGYGYISSKFVKNGNYIVILNLIKLIVLSLGGFLVFILNKTKRDVYRARLFGILKGSFKAFIESKNDLK
jgi:GT2 family glycosyltransferase